jgi:glycerate kinase
VHVVIAPDSMGGLLRAREVAAAMEEGWRHARPDDTVDRVPLSDGGEGLLDVLHRAEDRRVPVEVADPLGHPVDAWVSVRGDGTAVVESSLACGLHLVAPDRRDPLRATTYGVGQLLDAAREAGASRILVGLGGSATVEGGAGALTGLGFRLRVRTIEPGWRSPAWDDLEVLLLADVRTRLADAAARFGPQKGATPEVVDRLAAGLAHWEAVVADQLDAGGLAEHPGTGAAGGLGLGLAAALRGARLVEGAGAVAELVGLDERLRTADVVLTGEGRVDATSLEGKVVGEVAARARAAGADVGVAAGAVDAAGLGAASAAWAVEAAPAESPEEAVRAVVGAAERLARRLGG